MLDARKEIIARQLSELPPDELRDLIKLSGSMRKGQGDNTPADEPDEHEVGSWVEESLLSGPTGDIWLLVMLMVIAAAGAGFIFLAASISLAFGLALAFFVSVATALVMVHFLILGHLKDIEGVKE